MDLLVIGLQATKRHRFKLTTTVSIAIGLSGAAIEDRRAVYESNAPISKFVLGNNKIHGEN